MSRKTDLRELLSTAQVDLGAMGKLFEEASPAERVALLETVSGPAQARLWRAALGGVVRIDEMVPRELGPLVPVIFHGKNSLPAFSRFQKRFCRPSQDAPPNELWGYNDQPTRWLGTLTGPGYFVASDSQSPIGSVAVDYRRIPTARPTAWPELHDNRYRLSRFIFHELVDYLRRVSKHVLIGRATRHEQELNNYFILCREDPV